MGYWTHRVIDMAEDNDGDTLLVVMEVHCQDNGKLRGFSEPFTQSDTLDGLEIVLERMQAAVRTAKKLGPKAILKPSDFPNKET